MVLNIANNALVIIGGGFAGLSTALGLSRCKPRPPIVLFEPRRRFIFLPLLYELLSKEVRSWEVAPTYNSLLTGRGIISLNEHVTSIDTNKQVVESSSGRTVNYSQLVIGTGSALQDYGVKGVKEYAWKFQTLEDVEFLRGQIKCLKEFKSNRQALVVVGAGHSGVELACKLADLLVGFAEVNLIEKGPGILPEARIFNREQAEIALKSRGIKLHLSTEVIEILEGEVKLKRVSEKEFSIFHKGLIWSAGRYPLLPPLNPAVPLVNKRIAIDSYLKVNGLENVFAIGDAACNKDVLLPATAQVAIQQGKALAKILIAFQEGEKPAPFQFHDFGEMLSLGLGNATITSLGITLSGPMAFQLRRIAYLTRLPDLSLSLRSAGSWLLNY